jgi:hypothetical protein
VSLLLRRTARAPRRSWPTSLGSFVAGAVRHATYPLTPLIGVLYGVTFFVDILYILLLRSRLKECGISPWRRI